MKQTRIKIDVNQIFGYVYTNICCFYVMAKKCVSLQGITGLRQSKILNDGNPSVSASFFI